MQFSLLQASRIVESMSSKRMKEHKILEQRLKLASHAYGISVTPGIRNMARRERHLALTALCRGGVDLGWEYKSRQGEAVCAELLKAGQHAEWTEEQVQELTNLFSGWRAFAGARCEDWSVEAPSYASLLCSLFDSHKLMPQTDEMLEKAQAESEARCANQGSD